MKHLESFKSENIQSIYDFLEQDADVTDFKRDLIAVAEYKKTSLHDLQAEVFQYHDLMKEDLSDKITFVFREDGYLGMFCEGSWEPVKSFEDYQKIETGDVISVKFSQKLEPLQGIVWCGSYKGSVGWIFIIQNTDDGYVPDGVEWKRYGKYAISLCSNDRIRTNNQEKVMVKKIKIPNLLSEEKEIKVLKETMHFALVI